VTTSDLAPKEGVAIAKLDKMLDTIFLSSHALASRAFDRIPQYNMDIPGFKITLEAKETARRWVVAYGLEGDYEVVLIKSEFKRIEFVSDKFFEVLPLFIGGYKTAQMKNILK